MPYKLSVRRANSIGTNLLMSASKTLIAAINSQKRILVLFQFAA